MSKGGTRLYARSLHYALYINIALAPDLVGDEGRHKAFGLFGLVRSAMVLSRDPSLTS